LHKRGKKNKFCELYIIKNVIGKIIVRRYNLHITARAVCHHISKRESNVNNNSSETCTGEGGREGGRGKADH